MQGSFLLAFILEFGGFLFSLRGAAAVLSGVLLFMLVPLAGRLTGFKGLSKMHEWLAMWSIKRAAIVVSEHNDLLWKRMSFDDLGVEEITFGSKTKEFEDPAAALHHYKGFPFALADEVHGLLFDPRHAAVGKREHDAEENNEMHYRATSAEHDMYNVYGWVRGVFEMPRDHELVDLSMVRSVVTGNERAEYPERVEKLYKLSREPYAEDTGLIRLSMPIIAFLAIFGGMWVVASQGSTGGGGTTVGFGSKIVLSGVLLGVASLKRVDWRSAAGALALVLPLPAVFLLLFVFVNPFLAVFVYLALGIGFWALPFWTLFFRLSSKLGGAISQFYLMLAFMAYDRPVMEWTPAKYELREFSDIEHDGEVKWYNLANSLIGFTYRPGEESWSEALDKEDIEVRMEADGGGSTNIPAGFTRFPDMQRAVYGAFVPTKLSRDKYYLHSGIALSRFANAAVGEKSLRKLSEAKEKHGSPKSFGVSERTLLFATLGSGAAAAVLGVVVFFL